MGNTENTALKNVMKEYEEEDEDMVKECKKTGNLITFLFDLIDEDVKVSIKCLENDHYEYSYREVKETVHDSNFEDFLRLILDDLVEIRNKNIELYANMETPGPGASSIPFDPDNDSGGGDDRSDSEESEGELEIEIDTPSASSGSGSVFSPLVGVTSESMKLLREKPYEVLIPEELIRMQSTSCKKVSETLFVTNAGAKIILRAYRWDIEQIMNTFMISGKEKVLQDVGLQSSSKIMTKQQQTTKAEEETEHKSTDEFECSSCYDDIEYSKTTRLDSCGHRFCNDCWQEHLTMKIKDGLSKRITCMGGGCDCVVDENIVSRFIEDPEVKKRYDTKVLESFVEDNDIMKWCQSAPHCGNAAMIRVHKDTPLEIFCKCGWPAYCYACLEEAHNPASCKMMVEWKKKCSDDSETLNWIKLNTRSCPKCGKPTEKNGGCNHVSCKCGGHWCWACGGNFTSSTVYSHNCNRYLEKGEGSKEGSRSTLERYLHYFNHFNKHNTSIRNQKRLQMKMNHKIHKMTRARKVDTLDIDWLRNGMSVLFETRRALMHSYVFAFYLFDRGEQTYTCKDQTYKIGHILRGAKRFQSERERVSAKNLFEDTQEQLELTTEALNRHLDLPLEKILLPENKSEIIVKSVLCEKRVHGLFDVLRDAMIIEGVYRLPEPRYIVTNPSFRDSSRDKELSTFGFNPTKKKDIILPKKKKSSLCTFTWTGQSYEKQKFYRCITCNFVDSNRLGICETCKDICHKGHRTSLVGEVTAYCDCGAGEGASRGIICKCMK